MKLYLVRHAIAEDRQDFSTTGQPDSLRPLTKEGIKKFRKVAASSKKVIGDLDYILSSPFTRAEQTAFELKDVFSRAELKKAPYLTPDTPAAETLAHLNELSSVKLEAIACVGHEPHLSQFLSFLTTGGTRHFARLKKGSVSCFEIHLPAEPGSATLLWSLPPKVILNL